MRVLIVGGERLQSTDRHRGQSLLDVDAGPLALDDLRTHAPADFRHRAGLAEHPSRILELAVLDLPQSQRDIVVQRTGFDTGGAGALDAAHGLGYRSLGVIRQVDLFEVGDPHLGILLGDRLVGQSHTALSIDLLG